MIRVVTFAAILFAMFSGRVSAQTESQPRGVEVLGEQLAALSPRVRPDEANRLALAAHRVSSALARDYRAIRSPHFHNFLVNAGLRKRGLCHHWARDLGERLAASKPRSLMLRWAIARAGTLREHNAVVVTARGQRFEQGIVLDAWRRSGRLYFGPVAADKYPWQEDRSETFDPRRSPAAQPTAWRAHTAEVAAPNES